jgi:hypothetical protein
MRNLENAFDILLPDGEGEHLIAQTEHGSPTSAEARLRRDLESAGLI